MCESRTISTWREYGLAHDHRERHNLDVQDLAEIFPHIDKKEWLKSRCISDKRKRYVRDRVESSSEQPAPQMDPKEEHVPQSLFPFRFPDMEPKDEEPAPSVEPKDEEPAPSVEPKDEEPAPQSLFRFPEELKEEQPAKVWERLYSHNENCNHCSEC